MLGTELLVGLNKLKDKHSIIGDVRGKGLMIGMEMVEDRATKKPLSPAKVAQILEEAKDMRLLIGRGGLHSNVSQK